MVQEWFNSPSFYFLIIMQRDSLLSEKLFVLPCICVEEFSEASIVIRNVWAVTPRHQSVSRHLLFEQRICVKLVKQPNAASPQHSIVAAWRSDDGGPYADSNAELRARGLVVKFDDVSWTQWNKRHSFSRRQSRASSKWREMLEGGTLFSQTYSHVVLHDGGKLSPCVLYTQK